jgi:hypothetical protein
MFGLKSGLDAQPAVQARHRRSMATTTAAAKAAAAVQIRIAIDGVHLLTVSYTLDKKKTGSSGDLHALQKPANLVRQISLGSKIERAGDS